MELAFHTQLLRKLCENDAKAKRELGETVAEQLKRRLADLRAADSVTDLIASPPKEFEDPRQLAIELCDGYRLVLTLNHIKAPVLGSGGIDWSAVNRIKILKVERYG